RPAAGGGSSSTRSPPRHLVGHHPHQLGGGGAPGELGGPRPGAGGEPGPQLVVAQDLGDGVAQAGGVVLGEQARPALLDRVAVAGDAGGDGGGAAGGGLGGGHAPALAGRGAGG